MRVKTLTSHARVNAGGELGRDLSANSKSKVRTRMVQTRLGARPPHYLQRVEMLYTAIHWIVICWMGGIVQLLNKWAFEFKALTKIHQRASYSSNNRVPIAGFYEV